MPELTSQDQASYQKLYDAAGTLSTNIPDRLNTLKALTSAFVGKLLKPKDLSSFEELQSQVDLTGGYLTVYQLFATAIEGITEGNAPATKAAINQASQELSTQYNQLKVSLAVADDDFLENVVTSSSDPLFLGLLPDGSVKSWTQQILSDRPPVLEDSQVQTLITAWGTAVAGFVEDARKKNEVGGQVNPGQSQTIAHFFSIHDQLEGLYGELSTSVALNS